MTIMTRKDLQSQLEAKGVGGAALECLLKETGRDRHESRVEAARVAAEEYFLSKSGAERNDVSEGELRAGAAAVLWADVIGVGGREGVGGGATVRHPALWECGKGRKQATDGEAWSAAILQAARRLGGWFEVLKASVWSEEAQCTIGVPMLFFHIHDVGMVEVHEAWMPEQWMRSVLREGLRRSAGLNPWHLEAPFDQDQEMLPVWAALVNTWAIQPEPEPEYEPEPVY